MHWIPHYKDWRLNEKHYGALQGLQKDQTYKYISQDDLKHWRGSYDESGPGVDVHDFRHPVNDNRYKDVPLDALPQVESMKDCVERVSPFWNNIIAKKVMDNKRVIIVSHKNTLRAIFKSLTGISEEEIKRFQVPNALPVVFEFDQNLKHVTNYCLMDMEAHTIKAERRDLSYNNIDWALIKGEDF